ncbi:DNA mismatch repair endonuclease MutL [Archangium primigenium]|uniref:DNA mismatch repair endonuclease MutL n=1 Tax=[Archangium] primigenium TaxID=2792470 RepID=UPI00195ED054|nr:DNA mismatch repair endonuclease MutL [Archangium primigenium]MBM7116992.1 DNA mismatch repair endonuclease MutL [Archangium primigenium]
MARIARLSDVLINKIAAGEVVERPASVVKELVENSIDAGSRTIRVSLERGGLGRITVSDDGQGMNPEDARLCLERHATSKLRELDDLFTLNTKGFRGEALPAIASVSRFTLTTAERESYVGTRILVEGGGEPLVEEAPPRVGTVIQVEDLFYNTPARRKFMRRESTELQHAEEAVIRLALAHPDVAFFVEHGGQALFTSPSAGADPRERIAAALGPGVHPHLVAVEERRLGVNVTGYIASPEYTLPNARGIYTFVNRRYIRDRGLNSAIQRAFQEFLAAGRQPVVVLFIDMDPRAVDVNVHPQKQEVRFADAKGVGDTLNAAISRALRAAPWLGPPTAEGAAEQPRQAAHYAMAVERFLTRAQDAAWGAPLPTLPGTQDAALPPRSTESLFASQDPAVALPGRAPAFGQAQPQLNEAPPPGYFGALKPLGLLGERFHVCEGPGGTLVVLDAHAALERARLVDFLKALKREEPPVPTLFGATVELTVSQARALVEGQEALARLGLEVEPFGGTTLALKAVPPALVGAEAKALLEALARALPPPGSALDAVALAEPLRVLACHAARHAEGQLSGGKLRALLGELDAADFHAPCLHGVVVVLEVPLLELERRALRPVGTRL